MQNNFLLTFLIGASISTSALIANNDSWLTLDSSNSEQSINTNNTVWAVNQRDAISVKDGITSAWKTVAGELSSLDVMDNGRVWGINKRGMIFTRSTVEGSWQKISGKLKQLGVGNDGRVWGINDQGDVYTRVGVKGSWQKISGNLSKISVANDGRVWGINKHGNIYTRDTVKGGWQKVSGNLVDIKVANNGRVWGVNKHGLVYTLTSLSKGWKKMKDSRAGKIILAGDNYAWLKYRDAKNVFKVSVSNPSQRYTKKVVHFADEHNPHNRLLTLDYKNMKLLKTTKISGDTNHHADTLGYVGDANYQMLIPKGSTYATIRDVKNGKYVKRINLPFRPRSADAFNAKYNLSLLNSRDRPSGVLIDTEKLKIVGKAGFNITCNQPNIVAPYRGLYKSSNINNLKCKTSDNGGDQISGHPVWISSEAFVLIDRSNRLLHVYSIYKKGNSWATKLEQTLKTDTSLHQIIPKSTRADNNIFYGETEGNNGQEKIAGIYKWRLKSNGKGLIQEKFKKLIARNNKGTAGHNLYITPDEKYLYAPAGQAYRPDRKNLKRGGIFILKSSDLSFVKYLKAGYGAGHVSFSKQKNLALITNHQDNYVTAINYKTHTRIKHIPVKFKRENIFGLTQSHAPYVEPSGRYYYNFWSDGGVFFRIDLNSLKTDKGIYVGGIPIQGNYYEDIATNFKFD